MSGTKFLPPVLAVGFALIISPAFAQAPVTTASSDIGDVLADADGMVLYTFRNDEAGVSNCYDQCAENWPPFFAQDGAAEEGAYTLVTRTDGTVHAALLLGRRHRTRPDDRGRGWRQLGRRAALRALIGEGVAHCPPVLIPSKQKKP